MTKFAVFEIAADGVIHKLTFTTKASMEHYINGITEMYIKRAECGDPCYTCELGLAHKDDNEGDPGLKYNDAAFNRGFLLALKYVHKGLIKVEDIPTRYPKALEIDD